MGPRGRFNYHLSINATTVYIFFIKTTASGTTTMISTVVLALALVSSTRALPLTTQEQTATGFSPIHTEVPQPQFIEKTGSEVHQTSEQVQPSNPIPKVENVPVNVDHQQTSFTENPVLLPIQPLSVVPQVGQVLRPVIVPAEAITAGRVIIAGIETIQQRNFPDELAAVEPQVPYQQLVQQATYTPVQSQVLEPNQQQSYYPQPVEKQSVQQQITPTGQGYVPVQVQNVQEQLNREQPVQHPVENYKPSQQVVQNQQVYTIPQNVQQTVPEYPEKQGLTNYTPGQTTQQQVQQFEEKQVPNTHSSGYGPVQTQGVESQQQQVYSGTPIVTENVEKQVPQQVLNAEASSGYQQVSGQQIYDPQQNVEKQGQYPQGYTPVQTQVEQGVQQVPYEPPSQRVEPFEQTQQQVYNSQPVEQIQQQVYNNQPVEQVQPGQNYPVEQQVYSVQQPSQVSQHQHQQQQVVGYVPEQSPKTTEVEQQQVYNPQPEQVVNYASETAYPFGAKIPQQTAPVQTLSGVPQVQTAPVQPSVAATHE